MKKFLLTFAVLFVLCFANAPAIAEDSQYDEIYYNLAVPEITFENDVDPYEAEDNSQFHVSPYPLLRVSSTLVFKDIKIPANYYLISPRNLREKSTTATMFSSNREERLNTLSRYTKQNQFNR